MKISKDVLETEYLAKEKPMHQIAKEQGIAVGTIYNYIKKYKIKSRKSMTETTKKKISISNTGKSRNKGIPKTENTKERIRQAKVGKYTNPSAFGGHIKNRKDGYIAIYCPKHPKCAKDGYVMEHILVMEAYIGRYLEQDEVVHHINKKRNDNRIENLKLMTFKEHASLHMKERWNEKKGVMTYQ